jgi:glutamine---fructose-6-phosphate transaminase (isomerizing)
MRHMDRDEGRWFVKQLKQLPSCLRKTLLLEPEIALAAKKYANYRDLFFIGRRHMFHTGLEAALKLKEISYLNAVGYAAGEMKHGPIALIDEELATIALCGNRQTYEKIVSNLMEIKARKGPILALAPENAHGIDEIVDDVIYLPTILSDELAVFPYSVATQLFAYYVAEELGCEIDQPRNLAKSVTVE